MPADVQIVHEGADGGVVLGSPVQLLLGLDVGFEQQRQVERSQQAVDHHEDDEVGLHLDLQRPPAALQQHRADGRQVGSQRHQQHELQAGVRQSPQPPPVEHPAQH